MGRTLKQWGNYKIDTQEMTSRYLKWKYASSAAPDKKGSDIMHIYSNISSS